MLDFTTLFPPIGTMEVLATELIRRRLLGLRIVGTGVVTCSSMTSVSATALTDFPIVLKERLDRTAQRIRDCDPGLQ